MRMSWLIGGALMASMAWQSVHAADAHLDLSVAELDALLAAPEFRILNARKSRPKIEADVTLRGDVEFGDAPAVHVKIRPAERGGGTFNNEPRYELAAYRLQFLFLDPADYVVPPTALIVVPQERLARFSDAKPTFRAADDVLCVVQAWLAGVTNPADVFEPEKFDADPEYARQIGNLNVLTVAIKHIDSNRGNFLRSAGDRPPRFFSVDNGVAFDSERSDRGEAWSKLRVDRLPAKVIDRLRQIDESTLTRELAVLGEWRAIDGRLVKQPLGENLNESRGVRYKDDRIQLGLSRREIRNISRRIERIVKQVDAGKLSTF